MIHQKKKNRGLTFVFSLIPGAAEMYMGFMRNGLSLMIIFALSIVLPIVLRLSDVFFVAIPITYAFSFFHARNVAHMDDDEFMAMEDNTVWDEFSDGRMRVTSSTQRKILAAVLILCGLAALWQSAESLMWELIPDIWRDINPAIHAMPRMVIAVVIIIIGIHLVRGKKRELFTMSSSELGQDAAERADETKRAESAGELKEAVSDGE